jgi:hypothetical protein
MMVRVLDTYARAFGVTDEGRREDLATEIVALFGHGYRDEGSLLEALVTREHRQTAASSIEDEKSDRRLDGSSGHLLTPVDFARPGRWIWIGFAVNSPAPGGPTGANTAIAEANRQFGRIFTFFAKSSSAW